MLGAAAAFAAEVSLTLRLGATGEALAIGAGAVSALVLLGY